LVTKNYESDDLVNKGIKIIALEKLEKIIGKSDFFKYDAMINGLSRKMG